jgi:hypothetical protein
MPRLILCLSALAGVLLAGACSSTTVTGSWKNPDWAGTLHKVYIVAVAKQDTSRRIFEDEFSRKLLTLGVTGIPSYRDLPGVQQADRDRIDARVKQQGADTVLITRIIGKRTEEVVTPGRISTYGTGPISPYPYTPDPYYRHWGSYYDRSYETIYEPATVTQLQVVTIEANLYEAKNGDLIWSAQLDTVLEANSQALITDFIEVVTRDLRRHGIL